MFTLIKGAFAQRRKTVINSMANSGTVDATKEQLHEALIDSGIDPQRRGETFTLEEFIRLADRLRGIM
jgi:16S rRNA (adenine1518-N6/adenine1519-N6)-dimethyltransferase